MNNPCDNCKLESLVAIMTQVLKDNTETIKKLRVKNENLMELTQLSIDFVSAN